MIDKLVKGWLALLEVVSIICIVTLPFFAIILLFTLDRTVANIVLAQAGWLIYTFLNYMMARWMVIRQIIGPREDKGK